MQPYVEADSEDLSICNQFPIELFIYMCIAGRLLQHFVCGIANVYVVEANLTCLFLVHVACI